VVDPVLERVFEALTLDRADLTDATSDFDTDTVAREEGGRGYVSAEPSVHPFSFQRPLRSGPGVRTREIFCFYGAAADLVPVRALAPLAEARRDV